MNIIYVMHNHIIAKWEKKKDANMAFLLFDQYIRILVFRYKEAPACENFYSAYWQIMVSKSIQTKLGETSILVSPPKEKYCLAIVSHHVSFECRSGHVCL